jgi:hypothetical protein
VRLKLRSSKIKILGRRAREEYAGSGDDIKRKNVGKI